MAEFGLVPGVDSTNADAPEGVTVTFTDGRFGEQIASLSGSGQVQLQWVPGWTYMYNQMLCVRVNRNRALLDEESITVRLSPHQPADLVEGCQGYPDLVVSITP